MADASHIIHVLESLDESFPNIESNMGDLVAISPRYFLRPHKIIEAYTKGIFPWHIQYNMVHWFSPQQRPLLATDKIKISRSMRQWLQRNTAYQVTVNKDFIGVLNHCAMSRLYSDSSWLTYDFKKAYYDLHCMGIAESVEVWDHYGNLVGGLYGVVMNRIATGESMFSHISNVSKYALIHWCELLKQRNIQYIDCEAHTQHLINMGAEMVPRASFIEIINKAYKDLYV